MVLLNKLLPKLKAEGHKVLIFSQFKIMLVRGWRRGRQGGRKGRQGAGPAGHARLCSAAAAGPPAPLHIYLPVSPQRP